MLREPSAAGKGTASASAGTGTQGKLRGAAGKAASSGKADRSSKGSKDSSKGGKGSKVGGKDGKAKGESDPKVSMLIWDTGALLGPLLVQQLVGMVAAPGANDACIGLSYSTPLALQPSHGALHSIPCVHCTMCMRPPRVCTGRGVGGAVLSLG